MLRIPYYIPPKLAPDTFPILGYAMPYMVSQDGEILLFVDMIIRVLDLDKDQKKEAWNALSPDAPIDTSTLRLPGATTVSRHSTLPESFIYDWIASTPATEAAKQQACQAIRQHFHSQPVA